MKRILVFSLIILSVNSFSQKAMAQRVVVNRTKVTVVRTPRIKTVVAVPKRSIAVVHKNVPYHVSCGRYYRKGPLGFILVPPPLGLIISVLPHVYRSFYFNNLTYYYAEGVIYLPIAGTSEYKVVKPEFEMLLPELPTVNVQEVEIDGKIYFEFENTLYKQVPTKEGLQYKVIGNINE